MSIMEYKLLIDCLTYDVKKKLTLLVIGHDSAKYTVKVSIYLDS